MFFRVHEDVNNRDLSAGELYDSDFNRATIEDVQRAGTDVLISPMTPDSFEMLAAAHDMGTDIQINVNLGE
jgi:hypothetical protein